MPTNDVYELTARSTLLGQQIVNSVHLMANGGFTPVQADALAAANDFKDMLKGNAHVGQVWSDWTLRQVAGPAVTYATTKPIRTGGAVFEGAFTGTVTGSVTAGGEALPPSVARIIRLTTGLAGRSRRGRLYLSGGYTNMVDDGALGTTAKGDLQTLVNTFTAKYFSGGTSADWDLVVFSFTIASGWKPAAAHPHALTYVGPINWQGATATVTSASVQSALRVQRRRSIGVGS